MAKDTRIERVKLFEEFNSKIIKDVFEKFKSQDSSHKKFDDLYMLCICPKGRNGGINNRIAEVFYGSRPYDRTRSIKADFTDSTKTLYESGTTMAFHLNDHGYVAIMLHPSATEYTKSFESTIFVEDYIHPKKLMDESFLERQWKFLNSYMECTSIEGNPTWKDRLRTSYLRNFKNFVQDEKYTSSKISNYVKNLFDWVFKVGLSGLIIYFLTVLPLNNKQNNSVNNCDSIKIELIEIRTTLQDIIRTHNLTLPSDSIQTNVKK